MQSRADESRAKIELLRGLLRERDLSGVVLSSAANFAWLTAGGEDFVATSSEGGVASVVVTAERAVVVTDVIESGRLSDEELPPGVFEVVDHPWPGGRSDVVSSVLGGGEFGADAAVAGAHYLSADVSRLRWSLCPGEVERYRELGRMAGEGMGEACRAVAGGMTEHEVGSLLCAAWRSRGIQPVVVLVAADERIRRYRHPIPTDGKVGRYVMVVGCARKWGLIASLTRLVHFGAIDSDLRRRHEAVMAVDAAFIGGTAIGRPIGDAVEAGLSAYAASGFPDEWKLHHQGGPTGYAGREFRAAPGEGRPAVENQAFAWNPSITGTKSEDTFILTPAGPEIITAVPLWPVRSVQGPTGPVDRPDILQV